MSRRRDTRRDRTNRRMNRMERRMLSEVYKRLVIERARAKATGNHDMARFLTEEIIELELLLSEGERGLIGLMGGR